jgi:vacuolar-type H+-ATPase subunit I/STV1
VRRALPDYTAAVGSDSFLDVVTNIVGILIILVMVVGMRARNAPAEPTAMTDGALDGALFAQIESLSMESSQVQDDMRRLQVQSNALQQELAMQEAGRNQLALIVAMAEKDLSERKARLDNQQQQRLARQSELQQARTNLADLQSEIERVASLRGPVKQVKTYATPISKTVSGTEIHFQLSSGHIAYVPIEELFDLAREETRAAMTHVSELTDRVMSVGPKQGFEMHYTLDVAIHAQQGQMAVRSKEWQVVPVQSPLGETTADALREESNFRRTLARYSPKDTTVTLWTYPDSFADFRVLNEELHRLGYAAAGRPLPDGVLIGGSPRGSRSAAQ